MLVRGEREEFINQFTIVDPTGKRKNRDVLAIKGDLRFIQRRLLNRLFAPSLVPSQSSHGCIRNRSIKTNAIEHVNSRFTYSTDIASFYPSIHNDRVFKFFRRSGCHFSVARILTTLTTLDHHLALGQITSPILAEAIFHDVDQRIAAVCKKMELVYTRYVDDICISGKFDLSESGIAATANSIVKEHGFRIRSSKDKYSSIDDECSITGVRIRRGRLDVIPNYLNELLEDIAEARRIAAGDLPTRLFYTKEQLWGRVQFVRWLNVGRSRSLLAAFRSVNWSDHRSESLLRGLIRTRLQFIPVNTN